MVACRIACKAACYTEIPETTRSIQTELTTRLNEPSSPVTHTDELRQALEAEVDQERRARRLLGGVSDEIIW